MVDVSECVTEAIAFFGKGDVLVLAGGRLAGEDQHSTVDARFELLTQGVRFEPLVDPPQQSVRRQPHYDGRVTSPRGRVQELMALCPVNAPTRPGKRRSYVS